MPIFIFTILAEALVIQARHGSYSWKNTGVSTLIAVGHLVTQAAVHGVIFGIIAAAVYQVRLTTIPVSFQQLAEPDRAVRPDRPRLLRGASLLAPHPADVGLPQRPSQHRAHGRCAAFRLSWTPLLSGIFLFYLPIVWIGYDPVWVFGMASAGLTYSSSSTPSWCRASAGSIG